MHQPTALVAWKTVAIGALLACGLLWWSRPQVGLQSRATSREELATQGARRTRHSSLGHAAETSASVSRLLAVLEQASTSEARCAALTRLGRCREIDAVALDRIESYAEPSQAINVRMCAVAALGETQSSAALPVLLELLDDAVPGMAEAVVRALGQFENRDAREALLDVTRSGPEALRMLAVAVLAERRDPEAVTVIADMLNTATISTRDQLLALLGATQDPRALPILQEHLRRGPRGAQYSVINALGELGGEGAAQTLLSAIEDTPSLAPAALEALARTGAEEALETLIGAADGDYGVQASLVALQALTRRQSEEITALMQRALDSENPNRANVATEYFAAHAMESAVPALTRLASEGGQATVWNAVHALTRIGGKAALASVQQLAETSGVAGQAALQALASMPGGAQAARAVAIAQLGKGGVQRGNALELLSRDGSAEASAAMIKAARGNDPTLSAQALGLLGQRQDPESIQTLVELATKGSTPTQRATALAALSSSGHPSAQARVQESLRDPSPEVRVQAVQALAESHSPELERGLLEATRDADLTVVNAATSALAQLGTPGALTRLEEIAGASDGRFTPQALHALANAVPERAAKFAKTMASSQDPQACLAAVQVAGMFPKAVASRILSSAFQHADANVLREAFGHLGQLGFSEGDLSVILRPLLQNPQLPDDLRVMAAQLASNAIPQ